MKSKFRPTYSRVPLRSVMLHRRQLPPATEATAEPAPQRHVLPKNLHKAVEHLSNEELDLLHSATLEEMKRRGEDPPSVGADLEQSPRDPSDLPMKPLARKR